MRYVLGVIREVLSTLTLFSVSIVVLAEGTYALGHGDKYSIGATLVAVASTFLGLALTMGVDLVAGFSNSRKE